MVIWKLPAPGKIKLPKKNVAAYYDKLALVTRGPLFDVNRWVEIWNLNTGQYDPLLADYPPMFQLTLSDAHHVQDFHLDKKDDLTRYAGIQIDLDQEYHPKLLEMRLLHIGNEPIKNKQGDYQFVYFKGDLAIADQVFQVPEQIPTDGLVQTMEIPEQVITAGFDNIKIFPVRGDYIHETIYAITSLRLLDHADDHLGE
jgi:hypothetical protein